MKKLSFSLLMMATSLASLSCSNNTKEQATIVSENDSVVNITLTTSKEIQYQIYNMLDFVAETTPDEPFHIANTHTIMFDGKTVVIDAKTDNERRYKVSHYDYSKGIVFKDDGSHESYTITANQIEDDGSTTDTTFIISIVKVKAEARTQNIVKIYPYNDISSVEVFL